LSNFLFLAIGILLGIVVWQLAVWSIEIWQKNRKYKAAVLCSKKCGKPLLVAGGPWSNTGIRRWLNLPAHGGGDVCLDIACRAFQGHPRGLMADVTQIPFNDKAFGAVFASHLMEHLPSISSANRALDELNRVSEAVFIVCPSRQSVGAWLHRGHHLWVWQQGNIVYIKQRNGSRHEKTAKYVIIDAFSGVVTGPGRKI
jgi:hypothetical protein